MRHKLYYDIVVRIDAPIYDYMMYNEGFLIVKFDDDEIVSLEGTVTCDCIKSQKINGKIIMKYFEFKYTTLVEKFQVIIPENKLELPINIRGEFKDGVSIEIVTTRRINDSTTQNKYDKILQRVIENSFFQEER